jgi:hypothetical protein
MASARFASTVLGSPEPRVLGAFYEALLDFERFDDEPDWVRSGPRDGSRPGLSFQREEHYAAPVWPQVAGQQQMMIHLDIAVDDLHEGVARAVELGATLAEYQPQHDVRVLFDPHGHPFCLF